MNELDLYRQIYALNPKDFNTCFYCGCIATEYDLAPPLKYAEFYFKTREDADFYRVPSCHECYDYLKNIKTGLLGQRMDAVKSYLSHKYEKSLRIYEMWEDDDISHLDYNLRASVKAGLELGKESYLRYKFQGYEFEAGGEKHTEHYLLSEKLSVFGEAFDNFNEALSFASRSFRVPRAKLKELFAENDNNFDKAIKVYQDEMACKLYQKELKDKCKAFSEKYKQNIKFVMHTVEFYRKKDHKLTIDSALQKLFDERIKNQGRIKTNLKLI